MFSKSIVTSDDFLDMPASARALYHLLGMCADDDGFVNNPKSVMRQSTATIDDLRMLIAKKFIISFGENLICIKHWKINNYIQKDRYTETKHVEQKNSLFLDENKAYTQNPKSAKFYVNGEEISNVYGMYTQVSIGKVSIELGKDNTTTITNNNNLSFLETEEGALFVKVCEAFAEIGSTSNPEDFIAYNEARDWKGIGGEDVRENLVRYAKRWENGEESRNMIVRKG